MERYMFSVLVQLEVEAENSAQAYDKVIEFLGKEDSVTDWEITDHDRLV